MITREEVWLRAWTAVAKSEAFGSTEMTTRWADDCLTEFDKRFAAKVETAADEPYWKDWPPLTSLAGKHVRCVKCGARIRLSLDVVKAGPTEQSVQCDSCSYVTVVARKINDEPFGAVMNPNVQ